MRGSATATPWAGGDSSKAFLTAEWRNLLMLNYDVDPAVLSPYVPKGTELDLWNGTCYVSIVGFMFLNTRLAGVPVPLHQNFEEVNLRFYVRHRAENEWRRGVVFIKEIVPKLAIAAVARVAYNENYVALPMRHVNSDLRVAYEWKTGAFWNSLEAAPVNEAHLPSAGSEAEFITEHYWGYARQRDGSTKEYRVEHPQWPVRQVERAALDCDVRSIYGEKFMDALCGSPRSAFLAEGSEVTVQKGVLLR